MSKNFTDQLKDANPVQPAPAEVLINAQEQENNNSALNLVKALEIIDAFNDLDFGSRQIVLEKLKDINRNDARSLSDKDFCTIEEAAEFLDVTTRTIRNYLNDNKVTGIKEGKKWKISKRDLQKFL